MRHVILSCYSSVDKHNIFHSRNISHWLYNYVQDILNCWLIFRHHKNTCCSRDVKLHIYFDDVKETKVDIEDLLFGNDGQDFANLFKDHYSSRVFWYPFTDTLYVKTLDITDEPLTPVDTPNPEMQTLSSYIAERIGSFAVSLLKRYNWLTPVSFILLQI